MGPNVMRSTCVATHSRGTSCTVVALSTASAATAEKKQLQQSSWGHQFCQNMNDAWCCPDQQWQKIKMKSSGLIITMHLSDFEVLLAWFHGHDNTMPPSPIQ
eukprot:5966177-Ditylum_brightwellii.AAC.1